jgi:hypothetical protein
VPLSEVLLSVSRATGIEIKGAKGLGKIVSTHVGGVELFQALRDLLSDVDYAITGGAQGSASRQGSRVIILGGSSDDALPAAAADSTPANAGQTASKNASMQTASTDAVQSATQNDDAVGPQASSENLPATDARADTSQTEKLAGIAAAVWVQDSEALGKYMQDSDASVQTAAFNVSAALDNSGAVQSLLAQINDVEQPYRLQALELLAQSPQANEQTVMATLISALNGSDPTMSAYAALALAQRGTPAAMSALNQMLNSSNAATRVTVIQNVAQTPAGLPLVSAAVLDPDETVGTTAAALLQQGDATATQ